MIAVWPYPVESNIGARLNDTAYWLDKLDPAEKGVEREV